jgi:hypothetical protein
MSKLRVHELNEIDKIYMYMYMYRWDIHSVVVTNIAWGYSECIAIKWLK